MKLYGNTYSGHSYKVRLFLLLNEIEHEYQYVSLSLPREQRMPEFVKLSQFGEVPVLVDGETVLCQSNAILQYLAKKTQKMCGANSADWQAITEWLCWEANRIGMSLPNLRYMTLWDKQASVEVLGYFKQRLLNDLGTLDGFLSQSEFLLSSGVSIADMSCSGYLFWLEQANLSVADYPNIDRWLKSIAQLPHWLHPDEAMIGTERN